MAHRRSAPGSQASLRDANRARIIESLQTYGHLTQVELCEVSGLSHGTVSNIVRELSTIGVLHTRTISRSGRRATEVRLARSVGVVAGVHVSDRTMRIALADATGTVLNEQKSPLPRNHRYDEELDRIALMLAEMLDSIDAEMNDLLSVALGLPAPVDPIAGEIAVAGLLPGWAGVPVATLLSERLQAPVQLDSEENLGALAEARLGAGRGARQFAYLHVGNTISSGLVVDGRVLRGARGKAGQIGHVTLDEDGPLCACGNRGCLNALAGGPALLASFRAEHSDMQLGIYRLHDLLSRADAGDSSARRIIADAGREIGVAVAGLVNLFDPELVVIGGEVATQDELLIAPIRHAMERSALRGPNGFPEVVAGTLGVRAPLVGAISLAISELPLRVAPLEA